MSSLTTDKRKGVISNIHKSDIFFQAPAEPQPTKIRENLKSQIEFNLVDGPKKDKKTSELNFKPKFRDENAFSRRVKEFYGATENPSSGGTEADSLPTSSVGHINAKNTTNNTFDRKGFTNLTFKEKKILETCPQLSPEEVKAHVRKVDIIKSKEQAIKDVELETKKGDNCKSTYYSQQGSDIFNSKKSHKGKFKNNSNKEEVKSNDVKTGLTGNNGKGGGFSGFRKNISNESAWSNNLDWKDIDGMLYFHKVDKDNKKSPRINKLKELKSNFSIAHDETNQNYSTNPAVGGDDEIVYNNTDIDTEVNANIRNRIDSELKKKFSGLPPTKVQKSLDMSSSFHGSDFYSKNLKVNTNDRPTKCIELNGLKEFDNLNTKEIKALYAKQGIHVYDVQETGDIANGYSTGALAYKIRGNNEDTNFDERCEIVNSQIKKIGLTPEEKEVPIIKAKKQGEMIPINVKWNDTRIRQITDKRPSYSKKVMVPTKINAEDRITNHYVDHTYKQGECGRRREKEKERENAVVDTSEREA